MPVAPRLYPGMTAPKNDINRCNCIGYYGKSDDPMFFNRQGEAFFSLSGLAVLAPERWNDCTPEEADAILLARGEYLL
ncbi:MAG TPA: hypothetical protein VMV33_17230 [Rhodocyclaceae bacterium]|nr:hypothetical protein [Rhodocyclaceae bacterium]